ncbi:hypothetical protein D9758_014138 [Tetrapyrgos nigripes]|uniref:Cytochrome P450 n=1 Tax=Tetrapyrgos nigripes TaxID=182062 RepID=A0A8H5CMH7_9AGAR|nr:hypothetical protein D9758_014138 [Tetrapyrgos nigripes]
MTEMSPLSLAALLIVVSSVAISIWLRTRNSKYPPGPPSKPLIGNILHAPNHGAWKVFTEWSKTYGNLVFLHGLGNKVLVVNNIELIAELFEQRWSTYSHRPTFTVVGELMGVDQSLALMPYCDEWRESRKLTGIALNPGAIKKYQVLQEDITALLNKEILDSPEDFFQHVRLAAGRVALSVTYGIHAQNIRDPFIADAEECMDIMGRGMNPGAFLADLIPILKYLPSWVPFQKEAARGKEVVLKTVELPYLAVKEMIADGTARPSFAKDLLDLGNIDPVFDHRAMWSTSAMYGAGTETTYATTLTFLLAMTINQDVQRRAQDEIDSVIGTDRMPTIRDAQKLPYTMAVIKETMRWHPSVPLSIPRRTAQDDIVNGYFIPKDTVVIPNLWAISRDTKDPEQFNPDRFLNSSDTTTDPSAWIFGIGRRICPGRHLAEASLMAIIPGILSAFDISPKNSETLEAKFTSKHISIPEKFQCQILPRSLEKEELIKTRASEARLG